MYILSKATLTVLVTILATTANAHSWVEQLTVIAANGTFVGSPGYARGNVPRTTPDFSDKAMTWLNPSNGGTNLSATDMMCKETQRKQKQTDGSPRLEASAGAAIALRFQENGHVTLPQNQPGKPKNRGTVYVYGTTEPKEDEKLLDVHKSWNKDGTGGDKRGVLLSKQNFDDGRCYQVNGGSISTNRQAKFKHTANQLMGADLWCQQDIALPSNAPTGKPYTLYWVWDWPTAPGVDPTYPNGKPEVYSTCMDVDVVDSPTSRSRVAFGYDKDQSLDTAAIPGQFAELHGSGASQGTEDSSSASPFSSVAASPSPLPTTTTTPLAAGGRKLSQPTGIPSFVTKIKTVFPSNCQNQPSSSANA
ncbi:hypothetical protein ASPWEDRAFT_172305 [Aspergillus wentii DTO 134E9]|uniref:DUF7492 domain-containing protein n=1 Tax=Aspergillus wentii DTO 134E9 TaxID=1073089 RepID=A0A1L9RKR4_ASPWE|nr:uncharacterized protein ASPWEDRAFT_172305 [Aspergillus wentii DTO 134E9]OJJ35504.1 hypothetical protein ASPWEDRAFT_172305 [Aspergillus wentii DTO 134E9]